MIEEYLRENFKYDEIQERSYDDSGKETSYKVCSGNNIGADGKTCTTYDEIHESNYNSLGSEVTYTYCRGSNVSPDGTGCLQNDGEGKAFLGENGNEIYYEYCYWNEDRTKCEMDEWYYGN